MWKVVCSVRALCELGDRVRAQETARAWQDHAGGHVGEKRAGVPGAVTVPGLAVLHIVPKTLLKPTAPVKVTDPAL